MKRTVVWVQRNEKWIVAGFFIIFLIIGWLIFADYGISNDELIERNSSLITLKYALETVFHQKELPKTLSDLGTLPESKDKYYGCLLQLPVAVWEYLNGFSSYSRTVFLVRHLWNFLCFYIASIFFYLLLKKRFSGRYPALLGWLLLILYPRIFAESFYNNKDLLFLSSIIVGLYALQLLIEKLAITRIIFLGVCTAISANTRIAGFILLALGGFAILAEMFGVWTASPRISRLRGLFLLALFLCLSFGLWIISMPASWSNPIGFLADSFSFFSRHANIVEQLYMGKMIMSNALPWHYIPVWMFITTPVTLTFLFCIGLFQWISKKRQFIFQDRKIFFDFCILLVAFLPVIMALSLRSTLYNGWRHLYAAAIGIVYFSVFACVKERKNASPKRAIGINSAAWLSITLTCVWIIANHPYQMAYFEPLLARSAGKLFEKDYWYLSTSDCIDFILRDSQEPWILAWHSNLYIRPSLEFIPRKDRDRITVEYFGQGGQASYIIHNFHNQKDDCAEFLGYEKAFEIKTGGVPLSAVYRLKTAP